MSKVEPFKIHVPDEVLSDLRERLARTRFASEIPGTGWDYGTNLDYLKQLVEYWRDSYDWRKHEAELNRFTHFKANIDGLNLHFIHDRGRGPNPMPLLLSHGWPGSVYEFMQIIPMLTDPAAHGADWGAGITARLGEVHGDSLYGIHLNSVFVGGRGREESELSDEERIFLADMD